MSFGHVSEKTDAFSFGITLIELVTNSNAIEARRLMELCPVSVSASVISHGTVGKLNWPSSQLNLLASAIERLTVAKMRLRSTVRQEIGQLETIMVACKQK